MLNQLLILCPPPLNVCDRCNSLSLTFRASIHVLQPYLNFPSADDASLPRSTIPASPVSTNPIDSWRLHPLLRHASLTLYLTLSLSSTPLSSASSLLESWARSISTATFFHELSFTTSLSISQTCVEIRLSRASPGELAATTALSPIAGQVTKIEMQFDFASINGQGESWEPMLEELMPLTDVAIRSFWEGKLGKYSRLLGVKGVVKGCDERLMEVDVIADILARRTGGKRAEMEGKVWELVINSVKKSTPLSSVVATEERNEDGKGTVGEEMIGDMEDEESSDNSRAADGEEWWDGMMYSEGDDRDIPADNDEDLMWDDDADVNSARGRFPSESNLMTQEELGFLEDA